MRPSLRSESERAILDEHESVPYPHASDRATTNHDLRVAVLAAAQYALQPRCDFDFATPFKELGGSSITAAIILARLLEVLGVRLPLATLTASATLEDLRMELARRMAGSNVP